MLTHLTQTVTRLGDREVQRTILRLAALTLPPGITSETSADGVILRGKNLKHRVITDPNLRSFGR
jgi:hypothetical protein